MDPVWFWKKTNIYFKVELGELMKSVCLMWYLGNSLKMHKHIQEDWHRNNTNILK